MREKEFSEGLQQMGEGIIQTIRAEVRTAIPTAIIGGVWGLLVDGKPVEHAKKGALLGAIAGWELSAQNDPKVQWYDWAAANLINILLMVRNPKSIAQVVLTAQLINPKSFSGARKTVASLF